MHFFCPQKPHFAHNPFSTVFFSMKMAESKQIVLVSCIIDFDDIQVWLRQFSLDLNACKVMKAFLIFSEQILEKTFITRQALRFWLNCLNQTCISLKSIMHLTNTISSDSVIFIEKKRVENRLWAKCEFLSTKRNYSSCSRWCLSGSFSCTYLDDCSDALHDSDTPICVS